MFPVDSLPPQYCEERAAAEAARRLAQQQKEAAAQTQVKAPVATRQASPSSLAQALHPPLSRPGSSSVLGNIFQGFVKRASSNAPSPVPSATPSRSQTPAAQLMSDRDKKELETYTVPSWH